MTITRKSILILFLPIATIALAAAYLTKSPPFKDAPTPKIKAVDVCQSLGNSKRLVPALQRALPEKRKYKFSETRLTTHGHRYQIHCSARDGSRHTKIILRSRAIQEMSREDWIGHHMNNFSDEHPLLDFKAGLTATASISKAGIQTPCFPKGRYVGGRHNLFIDVYLREAGEASDKDTRQALIDIVRSAAEYAHKDAKCELPSKL
ncbi:hypothetical protein ACFWIA_09695 [Streptomyces sp. NPDC127068]|uniref:hypothetical protein n=1 Tax=Streptomyces sp. NPDC127068 TaxID=3347127 RepID=UPI00364D7039